MAWLESTQCCGIRELDGVMSADNAMQALVEAAESWYENDNDGAYIFFSVTNKSKRGDEMAALIKKLRLGTVLVTKATKNRNSGNMLRMYVWTVNKNNFKSFWLKSKTDDEELEKQAAREIKPGTARALLLAFSGR